MKTIFLIISFSFIICSCDLYNSIEIKPPYKAKIIWDSNLYSNYYASHTINNDFIYFYERPPGYKYPNLYSLTKLDAKTGTMIWRSEEFTDIVFCQPIVIGNYVYVFLEPNFIVCFDNNTGECTAIVEINVTENRDMYPGYLEIEWNVISHNNYLYMGLNFHGQYFGRFNVNNIIHGNPEIIPEILWQEDLTQYGNRCYFASLPVVNNNIIYISTSVPNIDVPVELAGFDTNTGQKKFYISFGGSEDGDIPFPETGGGIGRNPILIHENILYYLSWSISAWNLKTGEKIYRHIFDDDIPEKKRYYSTNTLQPIFYNNKIYYTSSASYTPDSYRNIHCIDAATGELVWNDIAKNSVSLHTNLVIAHNRLYVSQYSGLRVYEPETGKLIGVDKSFCGADTGRMILYNDYIICLQVNRNTGDAKLVAIDVS